MPTVDLLSGETVAPIENGRVVRLENDEDPSARADEIAEAALVVLSFPAFKDGRAYSQARIIRSQLKFEGDLRAEGEVTPDQVSFMRRCGFTSIEIDEALAEAAREALAARAARYQAGAGDGATIIERRLAKKRAKAAA